MLNSLSSRLVPTLLKWLRCSEFFSFFLLLLWSSVCGWPFVDFRCTVFVSEFHIKLLVAILKVVLS